MKYIYFLIVFFFFCNSIISQSSVKEQIILEEAQKRNIVSQDQLLEELEKNGITLEEAKQLAKLEGIDLNTFLLNLKINENIVSSGSDILPSLPIAEPIQTNNKPANKESKIFGSYFFKNLKFSETPNLFLATPTDYRVGPGDQLIINLFGALENTYNVEISREGNVKIDRIPPIFLSGLSLEKAEERLRSNLSKVYSGLNSNNKIDQVEIDVSLLKARSITINIVGNVLAPGTYTISGFSSVLNALYLAGGPNEVGTYRTIKIIRSGKSIKNIDLYDYFSNGIYPNFYLRDQDVIFVEPAKKVIEVSSGFKINGIFELKNDENLLDLLNYNGGFSTKSYKDKVFVESTKDLKKIFFEVENNNFEFINLTDGDIITAKIPNDLILNKVSVEGSVLLPGNYSYDEYKTVGSLIDAASGYIRGALLNNAVLYRQNQGFENEIISLNLQNQNDLNFELKELDRLIIPNYLDIKSDQTISVNGQVNDPKTIKYFENMTLSDAILMSGGLNQFADNTRIKIFRNKSVDGTILADILEFSMNEENLFSSQKNILQPFDKIFVSLKPYFKQTETYSIEGEIKVKGEFPIQFANQKISDIFDDIEFLPSSDINSIYVQRNNLKIPLIIKNNTIVNDLQLINDDIIFIPKSNNVITVSGEVLNPTILLYNKKYNFKYYIDKAGGYTRNSDKKKTYVIARNGEGKRIKSFLGLRIFPKLKSGDSIIIPVKEKKDKSSTAEVLTLASSLTSIVALIKIIAN